MVGFPPKPLEISNDSIIKTIIKDNETIVLKSEVGNCQGSSENSSPKVGARASGQDRSKGGMLRGTDSLTIHFTDMNTLIICRNDP